MNADRGRLRTRGAVMISRPKAAAAPPTLAKCPSGIHGLDVITKGVYREAGRHWSAAARVAVRRCSASSSATGLSPDRLIGRDFADYFTEPEAARAVCRETLANGSINDRALAIRHVSVRITDVLCDARTYCDDSSAVIGVLL
jgi:hypothetical protein